MKYEEVALSAHHTPLTEQEGEFFISHLRPSSREIILKRRECVSLTKNTIYFILDGQLAVTLKDGNKIIDYAFRYMPIGTLEQVFPETSLCYRAVTNVTLLQVSITTLDKIYTDENSALIRTLLTLKSTMLNVLLTIYRERCMGGGYQTIKSLIEHYNNEPRQLEGIGSYIQKRTHLSKGYIFSTLAKLKDKGYINIEDGRLIKILSALPESI
ncbi:helix-turn-helix domain-containing protein [Scandinavium goeteborgense]|uniref:helix-turn-helix domain-containing protein n=1 Tax=Scandinavium goeteborgense TaxID=1851514 RepID=UPI00382C3FC8